MLLSINHVRGQWKAIDLVKKTKNKELLSIQICIAHYNMRLVFCFDAVKQSNDKVNALIYCLSRFFKLCILCIVSHPLNTYFVGWNKIYRRNKQLVEYYIICCHQSGLWYFCYVINSLYCFHNDSLRGYILYVANLTLTRLQKGHCLFYLAQYMTTSKWAFSHRHHLKRLKIYYFFFKYFLIMIFIFRLYEQ